MSYDMNFCYTTGREIINFENSQDLMKGLQRFGLHRCDCNFLLTQRVIIFQRFTMVAELEQ